MLCQICGKNKASVHYTQINDNKMTELNLCEQCAEERGIVNAVNQHKFSIADLLASMVDGMSSTEEQRVGSIKCPRCGLLYSSFKETGRLGCGECYSAFQFHLRPLLRRIHGSTRHSGKIPTRDDAGLTRARQMQRMHDELQRAIESEEFERAAQIRDQIRDLEKQAAPATPPREGS